ncbi:MAG: hypothetical protein R6V05_14985, partial [Candidatus Brocadiia bacterium]
EPTNHLDIRAREAVEEALNEFEGTLLVVSHDRYFLDKVVGRVLEVRDHDLVSYPGGFTAFWQKRKRLIPRADGRISGRRKERRRDRPSRSRPSVEALERRITEAEQEKRRLEQRIEQAFNARNRREARSASRQLDHLQERLDALYDEWLEVNE